MNVLAAPVALAAFGAGFVGGAAATNELYDAYHGDGVTD